MIKVVRGSDADHPGLFEWWVPGSDLRGRSRQPLLDACRALKSTGGDTSDECGLFREGNLVPDLSCTIGIGAGLAVEENLRGSAPYFRKFRQYNGPIR